MTLSPLSTSGYWGLLLAYDTMLFLGAWGFYLRRELFPIATRDWLFSLISIVPAAALVNCFAVHLALLEQPYIASCHLIVWVAGLVVPLWGMAYMVRVSYVILQAQATRGKMQFLTIGKLSWANNKKLNSRKLHVGIYISQALLWFAILCAIIFTQTTPETFLAVDSHVCTIPIRILIVVQSIMLFLFTIAAIDLMWRLKEPFFVRHEFVVCLVFTAPFLIVYLVNLFDDTRFPAAPYWQQHWFPILFVGGMTMFTIYFPLLVSFRAVQGTVKVVHGYALSYVPDNIKKDAQSSKEEEEFFLLVVRHPVMRTAFEQFTIDSWCVENLQFWTEVDSFRTLWTPRTDSERTAAAEKIVETFLRTDAVLEVNVVGTVRQAAVDAFDRHELSGVIFDPVQHEVELTLRQDTFLKWRASKAFQLAWNSAGLTDGLDRLDKQQSRVLSNALAMQSGTASASGTINLKDSPLEAAAKALTEANRRHSLSVSTQSVRSPSIMVDATLAADEVVVVVPHDD